MKVNIKRAIKLFFQNPSLEMVFKEAIANSLDANATKIDIELSIDSFEKQESLQVVITDNGEGFTDARYAKFCELLNVDEDSHQGVGRLVYLCYFDKIDVSSDYLSKHRKFSFDAQFDEKKSDMVISDSDGKNRKTRVSFRDCSLKRLSSYQIITPEHLKEEVLKEFYPRFYLMKENKIDFKIDISLNVANKSQKIEIDTKSCSIESRDIPRMNSVDVDVDLIQMFEKADLKYSIRKKEDSTKSFLMTALCVDNRTKILDDIISFENLPEIGYDFIFLLSSTYFNGKVDPSRQSITLNDQTLKTVKFLFREKVAEILENELPTLKKRRQAVKKEFDKKYPHLTGYFNENEIGIVPRNRSIDDAQKAFLKAQKHVLEATELSDEEYDEALDVSSRTLTQYILYREKIISKVEEFSKKDSEAVLHNFILPKRSIMQGDVLENIYSNNLWLLDNKYMTYTTALSERTMSDVIGKITQNAAECADDGRPDIAIIFSDSPDEAENNSVDVVIVELKKRGITLAKTEEVESQLQQRAVKLLKLYPDKIQRMWFYGIVEFTEEFKLSLRNNKYTPLYSKDCLYYKENDWFPDLTSNKSYKVGTYILSIDAFIKDAKAHNEIFLNVLKSGFKKDGEKKHKKGA